MAQVEALAQAPEDDIATFAVGPDGEQIAIAPGSTMAPAMGHVRVFTSGPSEEDHNKMMLTYRDYPVTAGFTFRQLRLLVAEDFDNFLLSIHLTNDEGTPYDPDVEVSASAASEHTICTNGTLPLDDFHLYLWNLMEMVLGAFAAIPSQLLELPLDAILFRRLHALFSAGHGAVPPTILQTVVRMYREQGIGAFWHGGCYLAGAAFLRDALSRTQWSMAGSPLMTLPILTTLSAMFTFPMLYVLARGQPGASFAASFYAHPSLSLVWRLIRRIPTVTPLFVIRDTVNLLLPNVMNLLRIPILDASFAAHMLRTVAVHPVKLVEKRVMLSENSITTYQAIADVVTYSSWLYVDAIAVNIALRLILFNVQPICRTLLNRHMNHLTKSMSDERAVRRISYEVAVVGLGVPAVLGMAYSWWPWRSSVN